MPSPFPGMDLYLEDPIHFPGLHDSLITYILEALQPKLPDPYYAAIGDRVWVEVSQRFVEPDANVLRSEGESQTGRQSGTAVAFASNTRTQPLVIYVPHDEIREPFIEIYARQENELLVTTVEVLSLANKTPGEQGRQLYQRKQAEVLAGKVHLVEIDLLRAGVHTTAIPLARLQAEARSYDYHVSIHRFDDLEHFTVFPLQLMEKLPEIAIPLLPGDAPVIIDLQAVFDRAYDAGPYRRRVRYAKATPTPPLRPEQAERIKEVLREKGLLDIS